MNDDNGLDNKARVNGFKLAELLWDAESIVELSYLCRCFDSVVEKKWDQLEVIEKISVENGKGVIDGIHIG